MINIQEISPISCELSESLKYFVQEHERAAILLHESLIIPKEYFNHEYKNIRGSSK